MTYTPRSELRRIGTVSSDPFEALEIAMRERDEALAKVERLREERDLLAELLTEAVRQEADAADYTAIAEAELSALRAHVERLREALRRIANGVAPSLGEDGLSRMQMAQTAHDALSREQQR